MVEKAFVGTWEVVSCFLNQFERRSLTEKDMVGIRFTLTKNGDVSWIVPPKLKRVPLFQCETYEYHVRSGGLKKTPNVDICFGAYVGQIFEFRIYNIKPKKRIILVGDDLCEMDCHYVDNSDLGKYMAPFTLLSALEEEYFSDIIITAKNKHQFKVHKTILSLQGSDIDWSSNPAPFSFLSEDALGSVLYFLYAECLPNELTETIAQEIIKAASEYKCLEKLVQYCQKYLKRTHLRDEILGLLYDMHTGMDKIADYISPSAEFGTKQDSCWTNPAALYNAIKHCFREEFVVIAKFILFCDIFANKEHDLSNEEQDEILHVLKSKVPVYNQQFRRFLEGLKKIYRSMTSSQRIEVATFIVPEIESTLSIVITLLEDIDVLVQQIIKSHAKNNCKSDDTIHVFLTSSVTYSDLNCIMAVEENIKMLLEALAFKREQYSLMTTQDQVQVVGSILDFFVKEELPVFLIRLDEIVDVFDEKLELHEFKFFFKVETSKVTFSLHKLREHIDKVQIIVSQICDLVQRDSFTQTLQNLKLISTTNKGNDDSNISSKESAALNMQGHRELNLVKPLCVPPPIDESCLSENSVKLLMSQDNTDMEFEVICDIKDSPVEGGTKGESDKHIFRAHRVIVAARCDWFRRALMSGMKEAINRKIEIHDTNPAVFKIFLEYLYGGKLQKKDLSMEQLLELLLLSDRYEMDSLKQNCEIFLKTFIESDSALYLLSVADQYNANILKKRCLKYISECSDLRESEEFFDLPLTLQSEIFDLVWAQPKSAQNVPESDTEDAAGIFYSSLFNKTPTSSEDPEEYLTPKLESQVAQLRGILGDALSQSYLVQLILAADYNLERAINFHYSVPSHS